MDAFESLEMTLAEKFFDVGSVTLSKGPFIDGRTTGIEPAHGGFTIHCLDPLGYIRPYPRALVSVSIYDQILSEPSL